MRKFLVNILLAFDKHIAEFIKIPKNINFSANEKCFKELTLISKEARKRKIELVIIGSWALVILLKRNFKHINDIDLIGKNSCLKKLRKLLFDLGYKKEIPKWPHTYRFSKNNIEVEFNDSNHMLSKVPLETKNIFYIKETFVVASTKTLFKMYTKLFLRKGRNHKADLTKLKMLQYSKT